MCIRRLSPCISVWVRNLDANARRSQSRNRSKKSRDYQVARNPKLWVFYLLTDHPQAVEVTVLIPTFNEAEAIEHVIAGVKAALVSTGKSFEILVVDDSSADETPAIAARAGARVFRHGFNQGSGAARRSGIRQARGEIIVMLDGDGTYEPGAIPGLLEWFPEYDQVNGARTSEQGSLPALRRPAKWFIRMLAIYLSGQKIPDLNTGLKAFKRSAMMQYLWLLPDGFSCVTTMTLAFLTNGHPVKYLPTPYYQRIGNSKFIQSRTPSGTSIRWFACALIFVRCGFLVRRRWYFLRWRWRGFCLGCFPVNIPL